ncbi:MAG: SDR family oxidoreductase [Planctomycetes bacterium]|nr:SDR family oxidoreductase [Planctomycetota bacterium]
MPDLSRKIAIVTGGGFGIGEGIAMVLSEYGATVVIAESNEKNGVHVEKILQERFGRGMFIQTDVSISKQVNAMVENVVSKFGKIDILVNNAGVNFVKPTLEMKEEDWDKVINVDLKGTFLCSQAALRHMVKQKKGSIINIASVHTYATLPSAAPYAAAKGGVECMTKSMAIEFGPMGIRINTVSPGLTDTKIWQDIKKAGRNERVVEDFWMKHIPLKRVQTTEEVGKVVAFLSSDDSSYITGANIFTDGGMTCMLIGENKQAVATLDDWKDKH